MSISGLKWRKSSVSALSPFTRMKDAGYREQAYITILSSVDGSLYLISFGQSYELAWSGCALYRFLQTLFLNEADLHASTRHTGDPTQSPAVSKTQTIMSRIRREFMPFVATSVFKAQDDVVESLSFPFASKGAL